MEPLLTVREACELTGKSESTIKRLIRSITSQKNHPDRNSISPSAVELRKIQAAGEPYLWRVSRELLEKHYPAEQSSDAGHVPADDPGANVLTDVLRGQLDSKDQQIRTLEKQLDRKDEQIAALNERMRESNILMKELQQKVAIAGPSATATDAAMSVPETEAEEGTPPSSPVKQHGQSIWNRPIRLQFWKR